MTTVAVIQRTVPHYRRRFFEELYRQGNEQGLEVTVYTAADTKAEPKHGNFKQLRLPSRMIGGTNGKAIWVHGLERAIAGVDVVVAPQELMCLTVPYLWSKRKHLCKTWIWWGHGYNCQASAHPSLSVVVKERLKHFLTKRADGLITYTPQAAEYWRRQGFPDDRVQPYFNTIDVEGLRRARASISQDYLESLRVSLGLSGKQVLLFSGRLYPDKKVDFLLRAFALVKNRYPLVALLIIGDGVEKSRLERLCIDLNLTDVHFLGEITTDEGTAPFFSLADLLVLPSFVGLAIVHGFAFGLPIVTTDAPGHGPEIEYLSPECGVITRHSLHSYSETLEHLLSSAGELVKMKHAAMERGTSLGLSQSANHFLKLVRSIIT